MEGDRKKIHPYLELEGSLTQGMVGGGERHTQENFVRWMSTGLPGWRRGCSYSKPRLLNRNTVTHWGYSPQ